jgi:hypothetical protein
MEKFYVAGAVLVIGVIVWRGAYVNPPIPTDGRPIVHMGRGDKPVGQLSENFHSASVDAANSETARGSYPPRALGLAAQRKPPSDSWLLDADSDRERFRRIETVLRGLDVNMLEIGVRFDALHGAIDRGNFALAQHQAAKIVETARIGMLKRPGFGSDEGRKFLGAAQWTALDQALQAHDLERSRAAFQGVRNSCVACHTAQGLDHLNQSGLFDDTAQFSAAPAAPGNPPAQPAGR